MQSRKAGQKQVELCRIFGGEETREPAVVGIVDGQCALHAGEAVVIGHEHIDGAPELIGLRSIFGVIDNGEGAAREQQCGVERLGLGARTLLRGEDDLEGRRKLKIGKRLPSGEIIGFDDELDVELLGR